MSIPAPPASQYGSGSRQNLQTTDAIGHVFQGTLSTAQLLEAQPTATDFILSETQPDWTALPFLSVTKFTHSYPETVASLLVAGALSVDRTEHTSYLRVSPTVWRRGNMRAVKFGQVQDGETIKTVLLKFSLNQNSLDKCMRHMEESTVASYLADRFNADEHVRLLEGYKPVSFLRTEVITLYEEGELRCYCMEDVLQGSFVIYSDNTGKWNMESRGIESLALFSVWTAYEHGFHKLMVADLQGVRLPNGGGYQLTDPVVMCEDGSRFSSANRGSTEELKARIKAVFNAAAQMVPTQLTKASNGERIPPTNAQRSRFDRVARFCQMISELHDFESGQ